MLIVQWINESLFNFCLFAEITVWPLVFRQQYTFVNRSVRWFHNIHIYKYTIHVHNVLFIYILIMISQHIHQLYVYNIIYKIFNTWTRQAQKSQYEKASYEKCRRMCIGSMPKKNRTYESTLKFEPFKLSRFLQNSLVNLFEIFRN